MAEIIKEVSRIIKCSNPSQDKIHSLECMPIESALKGYLLGMIWIYADDGKIKKDEFMPSKYLQSTLSDTLNYFPILSGRMSEDRNGNGQIHLTNDGVLFTNRHLNCSLGSPFIHYLYFGYIVKFQMIEK
jgi:hypothetical protein